MYLIFQFSRLELVLRSTTADFSFFLFAFVSSSTSMMAATVIYDKPSNKNSRAKKKIECVLPRKRHGKFTFILDFIVNFMRWFLCLRCLSSLTKCWLRNSFTAITIFIVNSVRFERTSLFVCFFLSSLPCALFISLAAAAAAVKYRNQSNWYKNQPTHKPFAYLTVCTQQIPNWFLWQITTHKNATRARIYNKFPLAKSACLFE